MTSRTPGHQMSLGLRSVWIVGHEWTDLEASNRESVIKDIHLLWITSLSLTADGSRLGGD